MGGKPDRSKAVRSCGYSVMLLCKEMMHVRYSLQLANQQMQCLVEGSNAASVA
jgi:hypothetical protein